jgi:intraflagellar transport protein 80
LGWSSDGTQLCGAGGNGAVCFGHLIERKAEWQTAFALLDDNNHIHLHSGTSDAVEEYGFRDRVIKFSLGYNYLVVSTPTQCHIYNVSMGSSPIVFDIKDTVNLIVQSEKYVFNF